MKTSTVEVTARVNLSYDPESAEFKEALSSYQEVVDSDATESTLLEQVAFSLIRFGDYSMIEGVGYVHLEGSYGERKTPDSGITTEIGYDDLFTELI